MAFEIAKPAPRLEAQRRAVLVRLYGWAELFRDRLPLLLPACPLRIAVLRDDWLATFACEWTSDACAFAITFNETYIAEGLASGDWATTPSTANGACLNCLVR